MTDVFDRLKMVLSDDYTIERAIGSCGMATVYPAQDLREPLTLAPLGPGSSVKTSRNLPATIRTATLP
jgi:hypothetical protein